MMFCFLFKIYVEMKIYNWDIENKLPIDDNLIICLGSFETLHIGHNSLFKIARDLRNESNTLKLATIIFKSPIKNGLVANKKAFQLKPRLYTLDKLGFEYVFIVEMDQNKLNLDYKKFIDTLLLNNVKKIVCGQDFKFGFMKKGTPKILANYFDVKIADEIKANKVKISSSLINEFISEGNISAINELLIENYSFITFLDHFRFQYPKNLNRLKNGVYIVNVVIENIEYHGLALINEQENSDQDDGNFLNLIYLYDLELIPSKYSETFIEFLQKIRQINDKKEIKFKQSDIQIGYQWFIEN